MKPLFRVGVVLAFLFAASLSFAQVATTSLRGSIKDPSGALVPGAKVTITSASNGQSFSAVADTSGNYVFAQIPPARYTITVTATGFGDQTKTAELLVNQPATIDFNLTVQSNAVTVDVSAEAQTLNITDASLGNAVGNEQIQAIPTETRNVPDLLSLQPGVLYFPNTTSDSRNGSVNGGRSDQSNVTLDGVDDNDQIGGFAFTGVLRATQDSVEEFRVVTGGANADSGRSSGAQVSMVTKSGTNKFHGAAYEYHRPTFTVANDWFNKQAQTSNGQSNVPGKLIRNIFGGDLGGPIVKDKLFFFGNYEGERQAENLQVNQTVPTASYQQGNLTYQGNDANGQVVNVTLTPAQVAQLDAGCQVCNTPEYPYGPGPNPNALAFFKSMPAANGTLLGDGLNTGSYSFSSPHPVHLNTSIARLDYVITPSQRVFFRGNLQDDSHVGALQFPGQPASSVLQDNSKGFTAGHTWTLTSSLVNDLRYGYVRQGYSNRGQGKGNYVDFRFLSTPTAETRTTNISVPVHNIVDNLSWSKGNHTMQFGGNWRHILQNRSSNATSFSGASTNPYWLGGNPPSPAGLPVDSGFENSYLIAFANLVGTVPQLNSVYNYQATSATSATLVADGSFLNRHFSSNEYEWYVMDSWRVRPNLTITYGLRHTILQTPWETHGQQVAPTIDTHSWFLQREAAAEAGTVYEPNLAFAPSGKFYNKQAFWPKQKANFAPRLAIAYSPRPTTSIRVGAGIYYDHFGEGLVNAFDQNGSFGLSSQITSPPGGVYAISTAPRFTGRSALPPNSDGPAAQTVKFPYVAPLNSFAITWGLDSKIKTPYSEAFDFSVQQQLGGGFTLETAYVGRLGRHLLQELDLAEPVNYHDPKGGGDYYAAGTKLSKLVDQNGGDPTASVAAIPYFENVFPFMANMDYAGESATQAIYTNEWAPYRYNLGATTALADLDFFCVYLTDAQCNSYQSKFWQNQFSSLYALSSIGMSYYNAAQVILRHPTTHGFSLDFSTTWSHSIDYGSDTERSTEFGSGSGNTLAFSEIINTWKPYLNKASSDFDTRVLITTDWVYQLPFGKGRMMASNSGRALDAIIGGWQWSGVERWSTGLPFSVYEPGWTTNWQQEGYGIVTGPVKVHKHYASGNPLYFDKPGAINTGVASGSPIRLPYPGEAGQRNIFRGDGYFDIDSGLDKAWKLHENNTLKFAWEVYNVTNSVRFDPASIGSQLTQSNLGTASSLLTLPRRMQFSLRYDF